MKRVLVATAILLALAIPSFAFKEAMLNKSLEVGIGYGYGGFALDVGLEKKIADKVDIYIWGVFGGIGGYLLGLGAQADFSINVFKHDVFMISVVPIAGTDLVSSGNLLAIDFDAGVYGLFSFDLTKEKIPLSFSLGLGPNFSFSYITSLGVYYTINLSVYLGQVILQVGGTPKFAGIVAKFTNISF
ncbi:MAG: hypothetical protein ABDH28_05265 [Brevinematia bacterium]